MMLAFAALIALLVSYAGAAAVVPTTLKSLQGKWHGTCRCVMPAGDYQCFNIPVHSIMYYISLEAYILISRVITVKKLK